MTVVALATSCATNSTMECTSAIAGRVMNSWKMVIVVTVRYSDMMSIICYSEYLISVILSRDMTTTFNFVTLCGHDLIKKSYILELKQRFV